MCNQSGSVDMSENTKRRSEAEYKHLQFLKCQESPAELQYYTGTITSNITKYCSVEIFFDSRS